MSSITRNYVGSVHERGEVNVNALAQRVRNWLERAHSRKPRQEFWHWLQAQVRDNRRTGN